MKLFQSILPRAMLFFIIFSFVCGVLYTGVVTGLAQLIFPEQANGSLIEIDGKKYGSAFLGQQFSDERYLWGRVMNVDVSTYKDENGAPLLYAGPSNLSPASEEYKKLIAERVVKLQTAHPEMEGKPIPVDLVTCSGSGLDPEISPAAAQYQVSRIVKARGISEQAVKEAIAMCTKERFLGIFGEDTVNVLQVNLRLDGILK